MLPLSSELLEMRHCAVELTDDVLAKYAETKGAEHKSDGSLVTPVDLAIQAAFTERIELCWPGVPLLSEEMSAEEQEAVARGANYFILDPLDGTTNYVHGIPFYAVSAALVLDGRVTMAVTYDPNRKECFLAQSGRGAWMNDERLRAVSESRDLSDLVAVVDTKRIAPSLVGPLLEDHPFRSIRNFGSVALEWAWLAAGRFQVYLHGGQKLWDRAPGELILREAGGDYREIYDLQGSGVMESRGRLGASTPDLLHAVSQLGFIAPFIK